MLHPKIGFSKKTVDKLSADVLFVYNNTDMDWRGPGIATKVKDLDDTDEILLDCAAIGNIKSGTSSLMGGGSLPYKHTCHLAICGIGNDSTESSIRGSLRWSFQLASERQLESYVVPTLFEEAGGMPIGLCADIVFREIYIFAETDPYVKKITVAAQSSAEYKTYMAFAKTLLKKD